jgi:hypothetical protein
MLNIINSATLHFASFGVLVLLNDFFLQWLWEDEEGFHAALAAKQTKVCQSEGAEHNYLILVT